MCTFKSTIDNCSCITLMCYDFELKTITMKPGVQFRHLLVYSLVLKKYIVLSWYSIRWPMIGIDALLNL